MCTVLGPGKPMMSTETEKWCCCPLTQSIIQPVRTQSQMEMMLQREETKSLLKDSELVCKEMQSKKPSLSRHGYRSCSGEQARVPWGKEQLVCELEAEHTWLRSVEEWAEPSSILSVP